MTNDQSTALTLLIVLILFDMIPTWIAFLRHHPSRWGIAVFNAAFGWTVFGWIIALVWALSSTGRIIVQAELVDKQGRPWKG